MRELCKPINNFCAVSKGTHFPATCKFGGLGPPL